MTGLSKSISLSFMIVGHTKFMPDTCFGLLKQRLRRTHIQCLNDIANTINQSACVNHTHLVAKEDGEVLVPTYDWLTFFASYFRKLPQIKVYHNFFVSSDTPGEIRCKEFSDSDVTNFNIIKDLTNIPATGELPPIVVPSGLSTDRQWYLYDKIQPFCSENIQDLVCPLPSVPRPTRANTPCEGDTLATSPASHRRRCSDDLDDPPIPRKQVRCGRCGLLGHNRRSCKHLDDP